MTTKGGITPLMMAAEACSRDVVVYLLQLGADPLATDKSGRRARDYAFAANPSHEVVQILSLD